jgi:hypothetical protein
MRPQPARSEDGFASLKRSGNYMYHVHKLNNLPLRQKNVFMGKIWLSIWTVALFINISNQDVGPDVFSLR